MSTNPLKPIENSNSNMEIDLPNIQPLHHTIGLDKTNFYKTEDMYRKFIADYFQYIYVYYNIFLI